MFWIFRGWKIRSFLSQKVDGNIFIDYWKIVLNFLGMGNTVFVWDKKFVERLYLLITEMFLFWAFQGRKIRSFLRWKVDGKMIFTGYWKVLVLSFSVIGNTVFFWGEKLMDRWYLLITEKFLFWAFRWWERRSFF